MKMEEIKLACKFTKKLEGEKYFRCVLCNQVCTGIISRLQHHLPGISGCMKTCSRVPLQAHELRNLSNLLAVKWWELGLELLTCGFHTNSTGPT